MAAADDRAAGEQLKVGETEKPAKSTSDPSATRPVARDPREMFPSVDRHPDVSEKHAKIPRRARRPRSRLNLGPTS